jgi:IS30 family transposase
MRLFKDDLFPDQISGRLGILYPEEPEMRASTSAVYTCLYEKTAKDSALKDYFRQKQAKPRLRKGHRTAEADIRTCFH